MRSKPPEPSRRRAGRSPDQRKWILCIALASRAWEALTDAQRLAWNSDAKARRISGHSYFTGINARRIRDGLPVLTEPPPDAVGSSKPMLKRLLISNWRGQVTLKVEISLPPGARVTVWASRPRPQGVSFNGSCPRLSELPPPVRGVSDISLPYFEKHGQWIEIQGLDLVGKRIFVRVRQELVTGPALFEEANAVVPPPNPPAKSPRKR